MSLPPAHRRFAVAIHDVAPAAARGLLHLMDRLAPLVGAAWAAAVIPLPDGARWERAPPELLARLRGAERLLHGLRHAAPQPRNLPSLLCGGVDEFAALDPLAALARLRRGQRILAGVFGAPAQGFLAPAWRPGRIGQEAQRAAGLRYHVRFARIQRTAGADIPIATYNWDYGVIAGLGRAGTAAGRLLQLRPQATPVVSLHPRDLARGHLPRALGLIRRLLDAGRQPVAFSALVAGCP